MVRPALRTAPWRRESRRRFDLAVRHVGNVGGLLDDLGDASRAKSKKTSSTTVRVRPWQRDGDAVAPSSQIPVSRRRSSPNLSKARESDGSFRRAANALPYVDDAGIPGHFFAKSFDSRIGIVITRPCSGILSPRLKNVIVNGVRGRFGTFLGELYRLIDQLFDLLIGRLQLAFFDSCFKQALTSQFDGSFASIAELLRGSGNLCRIAFMVPT